MSDNNNEMLDKEIKKEEPMLKVTSSEELTQPAEIAPIEQVKPKEEIKPAEEVKSAEEIKPAEEEEFKPSQQEIASEEEAAEDIEEVDKIKNVINDLEEKEDYELLDIDDNQPVKTLLIGDNINNENLKKIKTLILYIKHNNNLNDKIIFNDDKETKEVFLNYIRLFDSSITYEIKGGGIIHKFKNLFKKFTNTPTQNIEKSFKIMTTDLNLTDENIDKTKIENNIVYDFINIFFDFNEDTKNELIIDFNKYNKFIQKYKNSIKINYENYIENIKIIFKKKTNLFSKTTDWIKEIKELIKYYNDIRYEIFKNNFLIKESEESEESEESNKKLIISFNRTNDSLRDISNTINELHKYSNKKINEIIVLMKKYILETDDTNIKTNQVAPSDEPNEVAPSNEPNEVAPSDEPNELFSSKIGGKKYKKTKNKKYQKNKKPTKKRRKRRLSRKK